VRFNVGDRVKYVHKGHAIDGATGYVKSRGEHLLQLEETNETFLALDKYLIQIPSEPPTNDQLIKQLTDAGFGVIDEMYPERLSMGSGSGWLSVWTSDFTVYYLRDDENCEIETKDLASAVNLALCLVECVK